jgi:hypothetical protein
MTTANDRLASAVAIRSSVKLFSMIVTPHDPLCSAVEMPATLATSWARVAFGTAERMIFGVGPHGAACTALVIMQDIANVWLVSVVCVDSHNGLASCMPRDCDMVQMDK